MKDGLDGWGGYLADFSPKCGQIMKGKNGW
jgi:hypothetical protein